jgi:3-methyladenine DNA glycosylase AlkC
MAAALKLFFSRQMVDSLALSIVAVYPAFNDKAFVQYCCDGLEALEFMPRALRISQGLRRNLPQNYPQAVEILMLSMGPPLNAFENNGLAPFFYLPHVFFIRDYGLGHFAVSMAAQYELTQRFTAEFSLRPFFIQHFEPCMALLKRWACDPNEHVRRLVSEGTRPRLPWAPKLDSVIANPRLTAPLLELLKDDTSLYVRRSVANHLNDVGKDHRDYLIQQVQGWAIDAPEPRRWIIKHALRSAIKHGDTRALAVMGFAEAGTVEVKNLVITPNRPSLGDDLEIKCTLELAQDFAVDVLVDLKMDFPGRIGRRVKIFKLTTGRLEHGQSLIIRKHISLRPMSTRTYYPGHFKWSLLVNGASLPLIDLDIE